MPSFQAGAFKVSKASFFLKENNNFFRQSDSGIKFRSIDNAERSFGKSKEKIIPLALNGGFEGARFFKKSHYIDIFDIHKLQVHLNQLMLAFGIAKALTFDEVKITAFLKTINKMFAIYDITEDQEKK